MFFRLLDLCSDFKMVIFIALFADALKVTDILTSNNEMLYFPSCAVTENVNAWLLRTYASSICRT